MTKQNYKIKISQIKSYRKNIQNLDSKPEKYALYSGDVDYDGTINLSDVIATANDASAFATGYLNTDLTGNNIVDLTDIIINLNNSINFERIIIPQLKRDFVVIKKLFYK